MTVDTGGFVKSLTSATPLRFADRANLQVLRGLEARALVEVPAGDLGVEAAATFADALAITGGRLTVTGRLETRGLLTLNSGGTLNLDGPAAEFVPTGGIEGTHFTFRVSSGAVVTLPGFEQLDVPGDFTPLFPIGTGFSAQGLGSRLTLPDMVSANGPTDWNVRGIPSVRFEAISSGTLVLPKLASLTGRTALVADDPDSRLEAPLLTTITGPVSDLIAGLAATRGGTINVPALTTLTRVATTLSELIGLGGLTFPGILDGSSLQIAGGSTLQGVGRIPANVENLATIRLDTSPGSLVFEGDLGLAPTSVLDAMIGLGAAHDEAGHLEVQGALTLDGTLQVTLANGYTPAVDDQFEIVSAATFAGAFASMEGLDLPNGLRLRVDVVEAKITLVVTQP